MNEIKHLGFKYHWPKIEFPIIEKGQQPNWWINFESNMIYIRSTNKIYTVQIIEENNKVYISLDDGDYRKRQLPDSALEAYSEFVAEKTLLE